MESGVHLVVKDPATTGHCEHFATRLFHRGRNGEQLAVKVNDFNRETADTTLGVAPTRKSLGSIKHFKSGARCTFITMVVSGTELDGVATVLSIGDRWDSCVSCWTTWADHGSEHRTRRCICRRWRVSSTRGISCCRCCGGRRLSRGGVVTIAIRTTDCCKCNQSDYCTCANKVQ